MTTASSIDNKFEAHPPEGTRRSFLRASAQWGVAAALSAYGIRKGIEKCLSSDPAQSAWTGSVSISPDVTEMNNQEPPREYSFAAGELLPHNSVLVSFVDSVERNAKPGELPETGWHPYETVQSLPHIAFVAADGTTTAFTLVTYCNGECRERGQIQRIHAADREGKALSPDMRHAELKNLMEDIEACLNDKRNVRLPNTDQLNPPPLLGTSIEVTAHLSRQKDSENLIRLWTKRLSAGQISKEEF
ncbi:MAG: hypothetical protein AAB853_02305, partial [Patescibacteria group bacterium]